MRSLAGAYGSRRLRRHPVRVMRAAEELERLGIARRYDLLRRLGLEPDSTNSSLRHGRARPGASPVRFAVRTRRACATSSNSDQDASPPTDGAVNVNEP